MWIAAACCCLKSANCRPPASKCTHFLVPSLQWSTPPFLAAIAVPPEQPLLQPSPPPSPPHMVATWSPAQHCGRMKGTLPLVPHVPSPLTSPRPALPPTPTHCLPAVPRPFPSPAAPQRSTSACCWPDRRQGAHGTAPTPRLHPQHALQHCCIDTRNIITPTGVAQHPPPTTRTAVPHA